MLSDSIPSAVVHEHKSTVDEKHAHWQAELKRALFKTECRLSRVLLRPATRLDALDTALYVSRIPLKEVLLLNDSTIRKTILGFQQRANALGLLDNLPKLIAHTSDGTPEDVASTCIQQSLPGSPPHATINPDTRRTSPLRHNTHLAPPTRQRR